MLEPGLRVTLLRYCSDKYQLLHCQTYRAVSNARHGRPQGGVVSHMCMDKEEGFGKQVFFVDGLYVRKKGPKKA